VGDGSRTDGPPIPSPTTLKLWLLLTLHSRQSATVRSVWLQLGRGIPWHRPCSPLSHFQFFDVAWRLNCSRAPSQINCFSERSMLRDSVYFTTLKSLDYNVVMTFRFNNNNKVLSYPVFWSCTYDIQHPARCLLVLYACIVDNKKTNWFYPKKLSILMA